MLPNGVFIEFRKVTNEVINEITNSHFYWLLLTTNECYQMAFSLKFELVIELVFSLDSAKSVIGAISMKKFIVFFFCEVL